MKEVQSALFKIADLASEAEDLNHFYRAIYQIVGELMWAKNFYIALYDEKEQRLSFPFVIDEVDEQNIPSQALSEFGKGLTAYVLRTGEPVLVTPLKFSQLVMAGEIELIGVRPVDWLGIPLKVGSRVLGVLAIQSYDKNIRLSEKDKDLLNFVSQHIASAHQRVQQYSDARQHLAELAIIASLTQTLVAQLQLDAVINLVGEKIRETFDAQVIFISFYNREDDKIYFPYFFLEDKLVDAPTLPFGKGLTSVVIKNREPLLINQDFETRGPAMGGNLVANRPPKSWLGVPVLVHGEVNGVISLQNMENENMFNEADIRLLTMMGESMWVAVENSRLYENLQRELNEKTQAENEIRRLNAELEARVAQRTAQLEAMNKELESFSYSVSHDLRAPLRAINGYARILKEDFSSQLSAEGLHFLQQVIQSSEVMGHLIQDMLRLSTITSSEMQKSTVDLSEIFNQLIPVALSHEPPRQVEFVVAPQALAEADPSLMRILLENLLNNALKFTRKHPSARIEFGVNQQNNQTVYFVSDDGAGFDLAHAQRLFGAFQRFHTADEFEGTGIGLATVQRIVKRHGGEIWAEGEVEKGATFYFTLG